MSDSLLADSARTLTDDAFEALQDAIVRGELPAGERIAELELCRRYGLTRGPLREAINRLQSRGLVVKTPHVGLRVVSLGRHELLDLYRLREVMEGVAARLAAERMRDEEIRALRALIDSHEQWVAEAQGAAYYQQAGDFDFHYRIVTGSRHDKLCQMLLGDLYHQVRMYRYRLSTFAGRPQLALREHRHIVEAIEQRDGDLAEFLMRRHISAARKNIESAFESGQLTL